MEVLFEIGVCVIMFGLVGWLLYYMVTDDMTRDKYYYITLPSNYDYELPDGSLLRRNHKDEYIITCIKGNSFEDETLKNKIKDNSLAAFKKIEYLDKPLKKHDIVILEHSDNTYSKCYYRAYVIQTVHKDGTYTIIKKGKSAKRIAKDKIIAKLSYKLCDLNPKYLECHSNF